MSRILLTSPRTARELYYGEEALAGLRALGEVVLNPTEQPMGLEALIEAARDVAVIVSDRQTAAPAALFAAANGLRAFVRCAVDIRNVDVEAATRAKVLVTRASPGFVDSVTELVIGFMIDLARGVSAAVVEYRAGRIPEARTGRQLTGSTVGIVGFGAIGRRLAERCTGLGMEVVVDDPFVGEIPYRTAGLLELMGMADFVVCLAVANERTERLIDGAALAAMRADAFFVNVSRGNLVDEEALSAALDTGRIAGCAMDVGRAADQMPNVVLARHPRVIATPHIGGLTPEAIRHQAMETVAQVRAILAGEVPHGAVNAQIRDMGR